MLASARSGRRPRGAWQGAFSMHKRTVLLTLLVTILSLATVEGPASAQPTVWTEQYGNLRQGYQSHESVLTAGNIATTPPTVAAFSALLVDLAFTPGNTTGTVNEIFAQPLYVPNVSSSLTNCNGGTTCNMLIVATLGGGLYAFNAGDTTHSGGAYAGALIWARNGASQGGTHTTNYFWYDDCN